MNSHALPLPLRQVQTEKSVAYFRTYDFALSGHCVILVEKTINQQCIQHAINLLYIFETVISQISIMGNQVTIIMVVAHVILLFKIKCLKNI
jgi:hypothetical protein